MGKRPAAKNPNQFKDFTKKKQKVGKKALLPDNFTQTAFRTKSISLPSQAILADKSDQIVNQRNQTLTQLLIQIKHYSAGSRKEALSGLHDLLQQHPSVLFENLGLIHESVVECMMDPDKSVRTALSVLLHYTFSTVPLAFLAPFLRLFIAYLTSALSHLQRSIRKDALQFLRLVLNSFDVWQFHRDLVPVFLSILSDRDVVNDAQIAKQSRNPTAPLPEFECLLKFLRLCPSYVERVASQRLGCQTNTRLFELLKAQLPTPIVEAGELVWTADKASERQTEADSSDEDSDSDQDEREVAQADSVWELPDVGLTQSFSFCASTTFTATQTPSAHVHSISTLCSHPTRPRSVSSAMPESYLVDFKRLPARYNQHIKATSGNSGSASAAVSSSSEDSDETSFIRAFAHALVPILFAAFLESSPSDLSAANTPSLLLQLNCLIAVLTVIDQQDHAGLNKYRREFQRHIMSRFPFKNGRTNFTSLNMAVCELSSFFMVDENNESAHAILTFLVSRLQDCAPIPRESPESAAVSAASVTERVNPNAGVMLSSLLPVIHAMLPRLQLQQQIWLLDSFTHVYARLPVGCAGKRFALDFIASLLLSPNGFSWLQHPFGRAWFHSLPAFLLDLSPPDSLSRSDLLMRAVVLQLIQECSHHMHTNLADLDWNLFLNDFTAFFASTVDSTSSVIQSPFVLQPACIQRQSINALFHLISRCNSFPVPLLRAMTALCRNMDVPLGVRCRLVELVRSVSQLSVIVQVPRAGARGRTWMARTEVTLLPSSAVLSFLMSALLPPRDDSRLNAANNTQLLSLSLLPCVLDTMVSLDLAPVGLKSSNQMLFESLCDPLRALLRPSLPHPLPSSMMTTFVSMAETVALHPSLIQQCPATLLAMAVAISAKLFALPDTVEIPPAITCMLSASLYTAIVKYLTASNTALASTSQSFECPEAAESMHRSVLAILLSRSEVLDELLRVLNVLIPVHRTDGAVHALLWLLRQPSLAALWPPALNLIKTVYASIQTHLSSIASASSLALLRSELLSHFTAQQIDL